MRIRRLFQPNGHRSRQMVRRVGPIRHAVRLTCLTVAIAAMAGCGLPAGATDARSAPALDAATGAPRHARPPCSQTDRRPALQGPKPGPGEPPAAWFDASTIDRVWGVDRNLRLDPAPARPGSDAGPALVAHFPAGSFSPGSADAYPLGGAGFVAQAVGAPARRACLSYHVRFDAGFDFVKGGKLPGLYGGTGPTGGARVSAADGFSIRLMWRRDGQGEAYAYVANKGTPYGASVGRGAWTFAPGRWTRIDLETVMNTPGFADGVLRVWVAGRLVIEHTGVLYRARPDQGTAGLMFSTFFGGGDPTWATPRAQSIRFADFRLFLD